MKFAEKNEMIFGTRVFQKVSMQNDIDAENIINEASQIMKNYEHSLSLFLDDSDIGRINNSAYNEFVKVSDDTFNIIDSGIFYGKMTDGLFDITIAPIVKAWNINTLSPHVPQASEISNLLSLVDYKNIELNYEEKSVKLKKDNMKIDLGGIAKGYIADKIIEFYKKKNVKCAIINLGGNIKVLGQKEDVLWNVGIVVPEKHSRDIACSLKVKDNMSVVTSGSYERAFICDGKLYHHIINPKDGYPCSTDLKSITIVNESPLSCDAYSTPLFIMGSLKAAEFMKKNNINGLMITDKDEIIISKKLIEDFSLYRNYKVLCF